MKIAVTVTDLAHVVHAGGDPHRTTAIIELHDDQVPAILRQHLKKVEKCRQWAERYGDGVGGHSYETVLFSLVAEHT